MADTITTAAVRVRIAQWQGRLSQAFDGKTGEEQYVELLAEVDMLRSTVLPLAEERDRLVAVVAGKIETQRIALADHRERAERAEATYARAERAERERDELRDRMRAALVAIIDTGPECQHCAEERDGNYEDAERPRERRPITHETTLWGLPVYLCAEHAPVRDASYRKAESKGSGTQPAVVPYVESAAVQFARVGLALLRESAGEEMDHG